MTYAVLQVLKILTRSIRDIEFALNPPTDESESRDVDIAVQNAAMDVANDEKRAPGDVIRDGMNGKDSGLGNQVPSLQKMAEDVGPIIDTFKEVLVNQFVPLQDFNK